MKTWSCVSFILLTFLLSFHPLFSYHVEHYHQPLTSAYSGKIDTIKFPIGAKVSEITNAFGKPFLEGYYNGWYYYKYTNMIYFSDGNREVGMICVTDKFKLFGFQIGMSMNQIKKIIGNPDTNYNTDEEDEIFHGNYIYVYYLENYRFILAEDKGSHYIYGAFLTKK